MKIRRRPSRSPDLPPSSSSPPNASAYALMTHSRLVLEKWSALWMCGSATFTMVASSTTISLSRRDDGESQAQPPLRSA